MQEKSYQYYIETDTSKYVGEWIAVAGDRILAHGKNVKKVVAEANKSGKKFILAKVPSQETMIF